MHISRRALLGTTSIAALALAGCSALGLSSPTTGAGLASDLQLFENALAAMEATLPAGSPIIATIEGDITTVEAEIAAGLTAPSASTASILESVAYGLLGLFPGGGTIVTIAQAVLAALTGLGVLVRPEARVAARAMTAAGATAYLRTLPTFHRTKAA